jgi:hypothetical protein
MRLDLVHPAAQKIVLTLEAVGDDKVRVNASFLNSVVPLQARWPHAPETKLEASQ